MSGHTETAALDLAMAASYAAQPEVSRTCKRCKGTKPEVAFHSNGRSKGRMGICGECRSERRRARGERRREPETSEQRLIRRLWEMYRLTLAQYMALADAQGGVCAICGTAPNVGARLFVDHCHATGVVRALLCNPCNLMIGVYENRRHEAAEYLAAYGNGNPLLQQ
ncbi:endonuclease VII domain-containing protein [Streptomyces sp. NPDC019443]|uniref:endonuclease VII domain-containing protein n=1 Tax=Streptomyces sp. NPDC019443 TaxID=3365061 RepID=UPI0037885FF0